MLGSHHLAVPINVAHVNGVRVTRGVELDADLALSRADPDRRRDKRIRRAEKAKRRRQAEAARRRRANSSDIDDTNNKKSENHNNNKDAAPHSQRAAVGNAVESPLHRHALALGVDRYGNSGYFCNGGCERNRICVPGYQCTRGCEWDCCQACFDAAAHPAANDDDNGDGDDGNGNDADAVDVVAPADPLVATEEPPPHRSVAPATMRAAGPLITSPTPSSLPPRAPPSSSPSPPPSIDAVRAGDADYVRREAGLRVTRRAEVLAALHTAHARKCDTDAKTRRQRSTLRVAAAAAAGVALARVVVALAFLLQRISWYTDRSRDRLMQNALRTSSAAEASLEATVMTAPLALAHAVFGRS
jgi:hypothetical protein